METLNTLLQICFSGNTSDLQSFLEWESPSRELLTKAISKILKSKQPLVNWKIIERLSHYGAELQYIDKKKRSFLMLACQKGDLLLVKYLIDEHCNTRAEDFYKRSSLIYALMADGEDPAPILSLLIEKGCDPNYSDREGNSVLHYAVIHNHIESINFLSKHEMNKNKSNSHKDTPLHLAVRNNNLRAVKILCKVGCNMNAQNKDHLTPLKEASGAVLVYLNEESRSENTEFRGRYRGGRQGKGWVKKDIKRGKCSECEEYTRVLCVECIESCENEESLNPQIVKLEQEKDNLKKSNEAFKKKIEELEKQNSKFQKELKEVEIENSRLQKELNSQLNKKRSLFFKPPKSLEYEEITKIVTNELLEFSQIINEWNQEVEPVYERIFLAVANSIKEVFPEAEVHSYGSYTTNLLLPFSDIDLVVGNCGEAVATLKSITPAIQQLPYFIKVEKVFSANIPLLKVTTEYQKTIVKIDISVHTSRHRGVVTAELVNRLLSRYSNIKPVYLLLKQLMYFSGFHEAFKGGISSFSLFLILVSYYEEYAVNSEENENIGEIVLGVLYEFGWNFDYMRFLFIEEEGKSIPASYKNIRVSDKEYSMPGLIVCDPTFPETNVAFSTDFNKFRVIFTEDIMRNAYASIWHVPHCECLRGLNIVERILYGHREYIS